MIEGATPGRRVPLLSTEELASLLDNPTLRIYDCTMHLSPKPDNSGQEMRSGRADWARAAIPGAASIDLSEDLCDPTSPFRFSALEGDTLAAAAGRRGIGGDKHIVLYDAGYNAWAARVWWMLRSIGFDAVSVLDGGLIKWRYEGRETVPGTVVHPPAPLTARPRPGLLVGKSRVLEALGRPDVRIVNALTAEQHAGAGGVHYGRAGRIPGSCNVSSRGIVDPETNALLPADELQARLQSAGLLGGEKIIAYCGGGIAASLTALALTSLGKTDVEVYMHSLQEWANDPTCPMERD